MISSAYAPKALDDRAGPKQGPWGGGVGPYNIIIINIYIYIFFFISKKNDFTILLQFCCVSLSYRFFCPIDRFCLPFSHRFCLPLVGPTLPIPLNYPTIRIRFGGLSYHLYTVFVCP